MLYEGRHTRAHVPSSIRQAATRSRAGSACTAATTTELSHQWTNVLKTKKPTTASSDRREFKGDRASAVRLSVCPNGKTQDHRPHKISAPSTDSKDFFFRRRRSAPFNSKRHHTEFNIPNIFSMFKLTNLLQQSARGIHGHTEALQKKLSHTLQLRLACIIPVGHTVRASVRQ